MKQLAIGLLFLLPSISFAATVDEQRHAIISQLIILIEQEISFLQAQQSSPDTNTPPAPVLGATANATGPSTMDQITQLTNQLQHMPDFQLFTGSIQDHSWFNIVTNQPVESITGPNVTSFEVVTNGDTNYRLTKDPAYTYKVNVENVESPFEIVVTDTQGTSITKSLSL